MSKAVLESIYKIPEEAPWTIKEPPQELVNYIKNKHINSCKILDVGCGEGYYSIYLASLGFKVTGIDISQRAINYSRKNAKNDRIKCKFIRMDIFNINQLKDKFDIIFEWGLLHFIPHNKRKGYFKELNKLLKSNGRYLSVSFNEHSSEWGGGRVRKSPRGNKVYYSSANELIKELKPYFKFKKIKTILIGKQGRKKHIANYVSCIKSDLIKNKNDK